MKKQFWGTAALIFLLGSNIAAAQQATPHYDVVKKDVTVKIDGKVNEPVWEQIGAVDGAFHYPW